MKKLLIIIIMLCFAVWAKAQEADGTIHSEEIDIIKPYQPILADAIKIVYAPSVVKSSSTKQVIEFNMPPKLMDIDYVAPTLKPVAMPKDKNAEILPTIYAKLGAGNYYQTFADLIYTNAKNKNFNYGAELFHHSAHADNKISAMRQTGAQLFGSLYSKKAIISGNMQYQNEVRNAYAMSYLGYNFETPQYLFNKFLATITAQNTADVKLPFDVKTTLQPFTIARNYSNYNNAESLDESGINWMNQARKTLKNNDQVIVNINWQWNELTINKNFATINFPNDVVGAKQLYQLKQPNSLITINPYYKFNRKTWGTELGLNAAFSGNTFVLMPHYESTKPLIEKYLIFYTGWKGWVQKNNYYSLQESCAWLSYTNLENTFSQDSYLGVKGTDNKRISYNAKFTRLYYQNIGFFVNNDSVYGGEFTMKYVKEATILNFHADGMYNQNEKIKAGFAFDYYNFYKLPNDITAWSFLPVKITLDGSYKMAEKIKLNAAIAGWTDYKALLGTKTINVKGALDVSLGAVYHYNKYISGFVQLNNLLNQPYQTFYGYKAFGLNGMLGVVLKY